MDREIQLIKGREKLAGILFLVGVMLELIIMMTDNMSSWTLPYRGRVAQVAFALFVIKIILGRYNIRQIIIMGIAGLIGVISYETCREEYVIRAVVFVAAAVGADMEKTLKVVFWSVLAGSVLIIGASLLGLSGQVVDVRDYGRGVIEARYCLGFNHANNVHSIFWYLTSLFMLIYGQRLKILHYAIIFILNIALYALTLSRTGLIGTLTVTLLAVIAVYVKNKAADNVCALGVIAVTVISIVITIESAIAYPYRSDILIRIDTLLTGRLEMVWEHTPLSTWQMFPMGQTAELVDNGFAVTVYNYGYVVAVLLIASIIYAAMVLYKKHEIHAQIILLTAVMILFMESTFIFNASLLCNMLLIAYMWAINVGKIKEVEA